MLLSTLEYPNYMCQSVSDRSLSCSKVKVDRVALGGVGGIYGTPCIFWSTASSNPLSQHISTEINLRTRERDRRNRMNRTA